MAQSFLPTAAVAAVVVVIVGWIGGWTYRAHRNRADHANDGGSAERNRIATEFALPTLPAPAPTATEGAIARIAGWRETLHELAIAYKNRYFEFIGRCGVVLSFVFIQMALSLTILKSEARLNAFFAAIDLFAMFYVVMHWWRARRANQQWVSKRIHSELLRQWLQLVFAIFPAEETTSPAHADISRRIDAEILRPRSKFSQWLGFGLTSEILEQRIEAYWASVSNELKAKAAASAVDQTVPLATYLHARPIRQLQWYRMRHRQFLRAGHRRGAFMSGLFLFTFALAAVNLGRISQSVADNGDFADGLNFALLVATAISAALTYWYVSSNERSISHRYVTQKREIESWLRQVAMLIRLGQTALIGDQVLEFEALMTSELIDWVHITSQDVAELGA